MPDKSFRLQAHETQWGRSPGLTMGELRNIGDRMYHPLNPHQERKLGQVSFLEEEDPQFLADSMETVDNNPDIAA